MSPGDAVAADPPGGVPTVDGVSSRHLVAHVPCFERAPSLLQRVVDVERVV